MLGCNMQCTQTEVVKNALSICYGCCTNKFRQRHRWGEHSAYVRSSIATDIELVTIHACTYIVVDQLIKPQRAKYGKTLV